MLALQDEPDLFLIGQDLSDMSGMDFSSALLESGPGSRPHPRLHYQARGR
jgi:hypothetical protein